MPTFRFFSDASERMLDAAALNEREPIEFDDHCVRLDNAALVDLAHQLGAVEEEEDPRSTSGVDGFLDAEAFSTRSNASRMPGYANPEVTTVFFKDRHRARSFPPRRKTRGQP